MFSNAKGGVSARSPGSWARHETPGVRSCVAATTDNMDRGRCARPSSTGTSPTCANGCRRQARAFPRSFLGAEFERLTNAGCAPIEMLTMRQRQIVELIRSEGLGNDAIAERTRTKLEYDPNPQAENLPGFPRHQRISTARQAECDSIAPCLRYYSSPFGLSSP